MELHNEPQRREARASTQRNAATPDGRARLRARAFGLAIVFASAGCGDTSDSSATQPVAPTSDTAPATDTEADADPPSTQGSSAPEPISVESASPFPYTVSVCQGQSPRPLPAGLPACDGPLRCGGDAHCFPLASLSARQMGETPDCSLGKCVPDQIASAQGRVSFQPCVGSAGPGACVPQCLALTRTVLSSIFPLGEAGCGQEEVCVPCLNPLGGSSTGVCDDRCAVQGDG